MSSATTLGTIAGASVKNEITISLPECPVSKVVVYLDRAEVTRILEVKSPSLGEGTININGITRLANLDSLSVKPMESTGKCDILEVSHETILKPIHSNTATSANSGIVEDVESEEISSLRTQIASLEMEVKQLRKQVSRIEGTMKLTQGYADSTLYNRTKEKEVPVSEAKTVLEFYQKEMEEMDIQISNMEETISKKVSEKMALTQLLKLKSATPTDDPSTYNRQRIMIGIDVKEDIATVKLSFSYLVQNATWSPSYDVRVKTIGEDQLSLSYFAEVIQSSGEDWSDCDLILSTSNPAIAADPPPLRGKKVDFAYTNSYSNSKLKVGKRGSTSKYRDEDDSSEINMERCASFSLMDGVEGFGGQFNQQARQDQSEPFRKASVTGTGDAGSTLFNIPRKVNIVSDNKPHKVMITARHFKPQLVHYCVPAESPHVYIQAKTRNNSGYPMLASNKVNIYLDGNFVSRSSLKQANSGETFQLFIGVDPAVKVEYLPTKFELSKKGWMSGVEVKKVFHKIVLNNSKSTSCRIILTDALPASNTDKITVELLEPAPSSLTTDTSKVGFADAEETFSNLTAFNNSESSQSSTESVWPNDFVMKNKSTNNIVWFKTIKSGEKVEIPFSYRMSWPQGSNVEVLDA